MIPNLDETPYSESLRRLLYDAVARIVDRDAEDLVIYYAWGRWFAVWRDLEEEAHELPASRVWQVVRVAYDPSAPDRIMLHGV
ncbi:MAG TPA: hypothetical protein VFR31_00845 [Thermoanaerobaculia bacterium]|nr:hypothetical protein [Thermoanaerobaculia bacterium]